MRLHECCSLEVGGSTTHSPPGTQPLAGPRTRGEMSRDWLQAAPLSVSPSVKCLRIVMNVAEKLLPFAG